MLYLIRRGGKYHFNRRVPEAYRAHDSRDVVRFALKTSDKAKAQSLAMAKNNELEAYWATLLQTGQQHTAEQYKALVDRARLLGFAYYPAQVLSEQPLSQIIERLLHIEKENYNEKHIESLLGKMAEPSVELSQAWDRYQNIAKDKILNKTDNQIRKWKNPRKKAMANFIACIGNKSLREIAREDALAFRDWWIERINNDGLLSGSANKDLIHVKTIVSAVADELKIKIDTAHIFKNLLLKLEDEETRPPFETSFILSTLLKTENLKGLNEHAKWALHAFAETGAGLDELVGLTPEDIVLDAEIPHIHIRSRKRRNLKTKYRKRKIPLVGFAMDAFRACPQGFTKYFERPDSLSSLLNKYLHDNNLMPSEDHSVYSLRHSFQDRLLAANTPDRVQADLMGHKFGRPKYGGGSTLEHKLEWMKKIQLKQIENKLQTVT